MSYEVSCWQETRIHLVAERGGEEHRLVHVLREPAASELRTYSRMRSEFEVRRGKAALRRSPAEADEWLWDQTAVRVEGYTIEGKELTPEISEWKSHVPLLHKVEAVAASSAVAAEDQEELGKNLLAPSGAS